jgi:pimeloyl-ACP methyl ester carboxylesterase
MKKWQITLMLIVTLAAAGYWFTALPAHVLPSGTNSLARFVPGGYRVITDTFKAVDESRPTAANNDYPGSPVRVLKGKIWRPAGLAQPGPLLVYSHGFMSFHQEGAYLNRFLASHGYTVVAVDYPLTNFFAAGKPLITDVVNQPGDVKFLIDTMLTRSQDKNDALHNTIDPQRIAVAGVSLGGLTSTLAAFHRKVQDPRIAAAISIAGPGSMLTPAFFAGSKVPFLMIYGDSDAIIPYDKNAAAIPQKYPGSILVTLKNASHAGFAAPAATFMRFMKNPDDIGCRQVRKGLKNGPANPEANFMAELSGEEFGLDMSDKSQPCTTPLIPVAMQAARQHMLTTLAAHAFLEQIFSQDAATRTAANQYLLTTFSAENTAEVSVTR